MNTLTIYSVSADVTLLNAIFNGVAMICQQNALIWGFALMASLWRIAATTTKTAIETSKGSTGGGVLAHGSISSILPFIFAMLLTNPALQSTVQVESTVNGKVTVVDNVPFIIAAIPSAASTLSQEVGAVVETAFQGTGTDYPSISASGNGFINPLKVLLTSRSAIMRIGSIDSQLKSLVSACLGTDSGVNYSAINALVLNAGNTGATSAQSFGVSDISGDAPTGIGALIYQASLNTTGYVDGLTTDGTIISCADAATLVAGNINTSLNSPEFARVVQGAATGMDEPNPEADNSIAALNTKWDAVRNANTTVTTLALGSVQAGAELINLLFHELTTDSLNCLKTDNTNRVACEAGASQVNEMERNNIQAAASTVPMLKYAGNFANYMLALMIGLGPVIVMFMMFAGVDAGKNIKTAAHIMIWPLLVMNVGAEVVNGMIYHIVANFFTAITHGGYLSPALAAEAYREFGIQIGTASQIMASLPIIMSMIFVLGESSALVGVANNLNPKGSETSNLAAPTIHAAAPLSNSSSQYQVKAVAGGVDVKATGAQDAVHQSVAFADTTKTTARALAAVDTRTQGITEGKDTAASWAKNASSGTFAKTAADITSRDSISKDIAETDKEDHRLAVDKTVASRKANINQSKVGVNGGLSVGTGGVQGSIGGSAGTDTQAVDSMDADTRTSEQKSLDHSKAVTKAIRKEQARSTSASHGSDFNTHMQKTLNAQDKYQSILSENKTDSETTSETLSATDKQTDLVAQIGAPEIMRAVNTNPDFAVYSNLEGRKLEESSPAFRQKMDLAAQRMDSGATEQVAGDPAARAAVLRTQAAVALKNDVNASPQDRMAAGKFIAGASSAMLQGSVQYGDTSYKPHNIATPKDNTGVDPAALRQQVEKSVPQEKKEATPPVPVKHSAASKNVHHAGHGTTPAVTMPKETAKTEEPMGAGIREQVALAQQIAKDAGLTPEGHGTVIRTAANVVDNVVDVTRPAGSPSRVSLGNLQPEKKKAAPASPAVSTTPQPATPIQASFSKLKASEENKKAPDGGD